MNRKTFKNLQADDPVSPSAGMELREMGLMWTKHYLKHRSHPDSHQICRVICSLVRAEARLEIGGGNLTMRLAKVLGAAGIPMEQFDECEAEAKQS